MTAILGPVSKASYQGFAGGPSWDPTSRYCYVPTQEGDCGILRIDTQSGETVVLTYACNNDVYNNPRKSRSFNGIVVANNSLFSQIQALNGTTMAQLTGFPMAPPGGTSQAIELDAA